MDQCLHFCTQKFVQFYLGALNEKINFKRNDFVIAYVYRGLVKILA